jgi:hypothetical protein
MNAQKMAYNHPDMFHDEAAHRIEWRLGVPIAIAAAILALYGLVYHLF